MSYVVISDCLDHDTVAVHLFQSSFIVFLIELLPGRLHPKKIIYFSDGAALQYKNGKNFLNLCHHKDDFGVKAQWHFSATSHVMVWVEDYMREQSSLERRFQLSRTIPCTRKLHSHKPISDSTVEFYSLSDVSREERVALAKKDISPKSIAGFVTCLHEKNW